MDTVQPLRISKNNTPSSSPAKMAGSATSKPLSEIGSTERRRNSPSYNQATKKMIVTREASPYTENSSPPSFAKPSPRDFWMSPSRFDTENSPTQEHSPTLSSPKRRPSVERLMQASRVRNSNIFALESKDAYDPSNVPVVERPTANRPLSQSLASNHARFDSQKKENNPFRSPQRSGHKRGQSQTELPILTPSKFAVNVPLPESPEKDHLTSSSPTKSSLARTSQFGVSPQASFSYDNSEDGARTPRGGHRQTKSVTFHHDPPVVNEYEEQTPEPSLSICSDREGSWDSDDFDDRDMSFDRGSSADPEHRDDSFDADLENTDKTPVVLPEDWSRMSPDEARTDLVDTEDDVFDDGESTQRGLPPLSSPTAGRVASDGEARPLPPLPPFMQRERSGSDSLNSAAERAAHAVRTPLSPPKRASCTKDEILQMIGKSSLQKRTERMGEADHANTSAVEEALTITNLDTGERREVQVTETEVQDESVIADLDNFAKAPPRISRESILRKVRNAKYDFEDFEDEDDVDESELRDDGKEVTRPSISELARMDPDQAIPSRENSREMSNAFPSGYHEPAEPQIKEEPAEDTGFDMGSIPPAAHESSRSPSRMADYDNSVLHHDATSLTDGEEGEKDHSSRYSSLEAPDAESSLINTRQQTIEHDDGKESLQDAMQLLTVKDYGSKDQPTKQGSFSSEFVGLPAYLSTDDFDFGMKDYITPSPPMDTKKEAPTVLKDDMPRLQPPVEFEKPIAASPWTSQHEDVPISPPGSPDSVIRHDDGPVSPLEEHNGFFQEETRKAPVVPDRVASIKTPGGKLKARPSATPADFVVMAEQRRMMSAEHPVPPVPAMYQTNNDTNSVAEDDAASSVYSNDAVATQPPPLPEKTPKPNRRKSRKSGGRMDLSFLDESTFSIGGQDDDLALGLDEDFDRITEAQKKGYHMRESTKVIVASTRNFSGESDSTAQSASTGKGEEAAVPPTSPTSETPRPSSRAKKENSSPRKASEEQFFKTEPWNGKVRRKSVRQASALKTAYMNDVAPPLPGQESALGVVNEEHTTTAGTLEEEISEGVERGRLFVKVVGVKDLNLPLPRNDRVYFQLTLDNGLHCVTTSSLELGKNAPIGQEFELVVLNDLEFQLTLTTKLPPRPERTPPSSSGSISKSPVKPQKTSGFSRFLSSPKKRAEKERQEREAAEAEERRLQDEEQKKRLSQVVTAWDQLHDLVNAADGSFARAYVNLKPHERQCFGRQLTVDVPCYNEWALENDAQVVNSVRSKRGTKSGPVRRPPYVIGQLQLQLLFVPKPKEASDEDMPKSMSAAIREMKKSAEMSEAMHEGHLSQQGGDCTHWRRRFFRLQGTKLTAYHEHTHQKRAVINLSKASRLVDDKSMLVAGPSPTKSGKGRRKSAFAEEDEAYQYVEEGFRMRFANGETIDFYADNRDLKEQWMVVLSQVIGKADTSSRAATWTDLVLARERTGTTRPGSAGVAPPSPVKQSIPEVKDFGRTTGSRDGQPSSRDGLGSRDGVGSRGSQHTATSTGSRGSQHTATASVPKSAPTSPMKGKPSWSAPTASATAKATRPSTPPLSPRKGGKARSAVKSMIF